MPAAQATLKPLARAAARRAAEPQSPPAPAPVAVLASAPAPVPAPASPNANARLRRAWSNAVAYAALVIIAACVGLEAAPWLAANAGAAAAGGMVALVAAAGAGIFGWRYVAALRSEAARLARDLDAAREAERWHRAVVNDVAEAVLVASPEGRLLETNQAAWRLLGRSREELSGRRLWDLLPLDERVVALRRGELVSTHGGGLRRLLRPDGTAVIADVSWSTLDDGRVIYLARPFK
jgi:PAS domain S-box-containing protein